MKARMGSCLDVDINHISKIFPRTTALDFVNCMNRILNLRVAACNAAGIWEQMGVKLATVVLHNSPPPSLLRHNHHSVYPPFTPYPSPSSPLQSKGENPRAADVQKLLLFNQGFLHILIYIYAHLDRIRRNGDWFVLQHIGLLATIRQKLAIKNCFGREEREGGRGVAAHE